MTHEQAAQLIHDNDTLAFAAFGSLGFPEEFAAAVGERFAKTGSPRDMTLLHCAGLGVWQENRMLEPMSRKGMFKCSIGGHITPMLQICQQIVDNEMEGYNLPLGMVSHIMRASASKKPGVLSKIGLKTFIDPRMSGGALNERSKQKLVELMEIDGEEYLFYRSFKPDVAILRATAADPAGNITMEHEAQLGDGYHYALAAKVNGGKVIVQVERLSGLPADPRDVKIPGILVDAIVVEPGQWQTFLSPYNPVYTGEHVLPQDDCGAEVDRLLALNLAAGRKRERGNLHNVIARRAAMQLRPDTLVNLGIGIPEMVPAAAKQMGREIPITLTVESGIIGGTPAPGIDFGASINAHMHLSTADMIDLYDGGILDMAFLGAMQVDAAGNVNVSKSGERIIGVGGFVNLTQTAKEVYYCFPFTAGGLQVDISDNQITIVKEGRHRKFCASLDQLSASAEFSLDIGQKVLYVTERCVFELTKQGLCLIEIAPGIDLERDILANMDYRPLVAENLKLMDAALFF